MAILGKSGAGKPLAQIIVRSFEVETGSIQVNGDQVSSIPEMKFSIPWELCLRKLFSGTLRENLTLGYDDFTDEEWVLH